MSSFYDDASWLLIPSGIKEDVVYAQKPTSGLGDLTFTRASDATYTDSTGVIRRSPYNLLRFSEMFSDGVYTKVATTITANTIVAPNGTLTADKLVSTSASSSHSVYQNLGNVGDVRTISCFVKKAEYRYVNLQYGTAATRFDFDTLTFSGGTNNAYVDYGNGWYRISSVLTAAVNARASIAIPDNSGNFSYVGDNVSGTFIWGFQAVEGTEALDYFPTTDRQNVPRIDFRNADGTLSSCGRLLLEPQRTNLQVYSNSFISNWNLNDVTTSVGESTLIGGQSTILMTENTANAVHRVVSTIVTTFTIGQTYTMSFYAKSNGSRNIGLRTGITGTATNIIFNPNTQAVVSLPSGFTANITSANDGYYRYSITVIASASSDLLSVVMFSGTSLVYTGSGESIYISAIQTEQGAYPTTYIPTTTAAVTRLADAASKTGVSSLIGQTEGTLFANVQFNILDNTDSWLTISSGNNVNWIFFGKNSNKIRAYVKGNNLIVFDNSVTNITSNQSMKIALAYKSGDIALYINGGLIATTTSSFTFSSSLSLIAVDSSNGTSENVTLTSIYEEAALFKTRLTNAQLAQLTTL